MNQDVHETFNVILVLRQNINTSAPFFFPYYFFFLTTLWEIQNTNVSVKNQEIFTIKLFSYFELHLIVRIKM